MKNAKALFAFVRSRGGALMSQVSEEAQKHPDFLKALGALYLTKQQIDKAVGSALKTMNIPTRTEFKRAVARIDALERELAELRAKASAAPPAPAPRKKAAAPRRARKKGAPPAGA